MLTPTKDHVPPLRVEMLIRAAADEEHLATRVTQRWSIEQNLPLTFPNLAIKSERAQRMRNGSSTLHSPIIAHILIWSIVDRKKGQ